jgi:hypothetical protein
MQINNKQIYSPSQPLGQSPAEYAVTRRLTAVLTGSQIIRYGFSPLNGVVTLKEGLVTRA